jgi:serine/threonine-protein kinase
MPSTIETLKREPGTGTLSSRWSEVPAAHETAGSPTLRLVAATSQGLADSAGLIRFRRAFTAAYLAWGAYLWLDAAVTRHANAGPFSWFLGLRIVVLVVGTPLLVRLYRPPPPSRLMLTVIDLIGYMTPSACVALMCIAFRGLESPYAPGLSIILMARAVTAQDRWPRGLVMTGMPIAAFYIVLFGAGPFVPAVRQQMHDPVALTALATSTVYAISAYFFGVLGGHVVWTLERQVFEARQLGAYKLVRPIGRGAHGEVWLARHAALKRDVAVKILRPEVRDPLGIARFTREAQATSELAHPNTVRVFDFGGTEDGLWYYVMEWLDGETLAGLVEREGPLEPRRAARLAQQAARALGEAHARGIVHRDVKPSNLFVTTLGGERDFVKVLDFGIARLVRSDRAAQTSLTGEGSLIGTPAYMSPEAIQQGDVRASADVYALGAVLYFMLVGRPPFATEDAGAFSVLAAHLTAAPLPPSARLGRPLPADLEAIVLRCLAKNPGERYPDGATLAAVLAASNVAGVGRSVDEGAGGAPVSETRDAGWAEVD